MTGVLRWGREVILPVRSIVRAPVKPAGAAKRTRRDNPTSRLEGYLLAGVLVDFGRSDTVHIRRRCLLRTSCGPSWDRGYRIAVRAFRRCKHNRQTSISSLGVLAWGSSSDNRRGGDLMLISQQGIDTLGTAFIVGLLIALITANSGMSALFDALNVVYDEREKRSLVRFYATTFLFTIVGIRAISNPTMKAVPRVSIPCWEMSMICSAIMEKLQARTPREEIDVCLLCLHRRKARTAIR